MSIFSLAACPVCEHWPRERIGERCPECGDEIHPGYVVILGRSVRPPMMSLAYYEKKRAETGEAE